MIGTSHSKNGAKMLCEGAHQESIEETQLRSILQVEMLHRLFRHV